MSSGPSLVCPLSSRPKSLRWGLTTSIGASGAGESSGFQRIHDGADSDLMASTLLPALLGVALVGAAFAAYTWVSPTVGGPFFDRHPSLKAFQRLFMPIAMGLVGVGVTVAALVH